MWFDVLFKQTMRSLLRSCKIWYIKITENKVNCIFLECVSYILNCSDKILLNIWKQYLNWKLFTTPNFKNVHSTISYNSFKIYDGLNKFQKKSGNFAKFGQGYSEKIKELYLKSFVTL